MSRGVMPRSWKFPETDPVFATDVKSYAHLSDAAFALIATVGLRQYNLAYEIAVGITTHHLNNRTSVTEWANFANGADMSNNKVRNRTNALVAYALGYYLEMYPDTPGTCDIATALRWLLHYMETERVMYQRNGLMKDGAGDIDVWTTDNLLAYFAFKQAGLVFNEPNYTTTSNEIVSAVNLRLWRTTTFVAGVNDSGGDELYMDLFTLIMGVYFWVERGEISIANDLLTQIESLFTTSDTQNGAKGYAATTGTMDKVWFEGSYMVAMAFHKVGNASKYKVICDELNKYIDMSDGGQVGTIEKIEVGSDAGQQYIRYKAVGSTAWAIIANKLKSTIFSTRTGVTPLTGCITPLFNQQQAGTFYKTGCDLEISDPSSIQWTVRAGRFIDFIDQNLANQHALDEMNADGQLKADIEGVCLLKVEIGNDEMTDTFYSENCGGNQTPVAVEYTIGADTYFAQTKEEANAQAQAQLAVVGQSFANAQNQCQNNTTTNYIWFSVREENTWDNKYVYITAYSMMPVNTTVFIQTRTFSEMGAEMVSPQLQIYEGSTTSGEQWLGQFGSGNDGPVTDGYGYTEISQITPTEFNGMTYETW